MTLSSPVTYQGGKTRLAGKILDIIQPSGPFLDLCCGSGAITIELLNRKYSYPITMVDNGPWGLVWQAVCEGTFNMRGFRELVNGMPEPALIQGYLKELAAKPVSDPALHYLILQAGSFGGKALWIRDGKWRNTSFRSYWMPTATSNRRSHVNPMMPMPATLLERMEVLCDVLPARGVVARHMDVREMDIYPTDTVYIDPPYSGTTGYEDTFDVVEFARKQLCEVWVSEGRPLGLSTHLVSEGRAKGGISGERKRTANEEWLTRFINVEKEPS